MGKVTGLGHFGIFVKDMPSMLDFYTNVLGLTLTDHDDNGRISFLSAHPDSEHHEIALAAFGDQRTNAGQISFHVDSLADLKDMHKKLKDRGVTFDRIVNHGIALGMYFFDPEENRVEVYWSTGIDYPQPFSEPIDIEQSDETLVGLVENLPERHATRPRYYGKDLGKRLVAETVH